MNLGVGDSALQALNEKCKNYSFSNITRPNRSHTTGKSVLLCWTGGVGMLKQTGKCFENVMGYLVLAICDEILATRDIHVWYKGVVFCLHLLKCCF